MNQSIVSLLQMEDANKAGLLQLGKQGRKETSIADKEKGIKADLRKLKAEEENIRGMYVAAENDSSKMT